MLALLSSASAAEDANGSISSVPLSAQPILESPTMFRVLPAKETGLVSTNDYADPKMRGELFEEFEGGSIGTGIAIGDYDGDGRPDVFVVSKTESCRLFRNLGDFKFEDVTEKAGVGDKGAAALIWKHGATFADVNNDGRLDLYVCRFNAPNLLYINQGDGTFKEQARAYHLDVQDASVMAAFCDYDRDGWLDVYVATNILDHAKHPSGQRGYLFHNHRDGTFDNVTDVAGISGEHQAHSATWWDYDNDGWPDLYVAYDFGLPDSLYHNNRDGTFTSKIDDVAPHTSLSSMGSDSGDVNNDGLIDFLVADMAATTHVIDHHMMADARGRTPELPLDSTAAPKFHRNALLLNTGTGRCLEAACLAGLAATDWTWSPRFEDLDNDGRLDLFVTTGFPGDPGEDTVRKMMKAESLAERMRIMFDTRDLAEPNLALRNLGDLQFENVGPAWGLDQKGVSFGAAFGDLGGDGNLDLVYSNYHAGASCLRNLNRSGHRVMLDLRGRISNRFGIGAKVRVESALGVQASQLWHARGYLSSSEPSLHFGLGSDTTIRQLTVWWPSGHVQTFENLPVDRRYTIIEPASVPQPFSNGDRRPVTQFSETSQSTGLSIRSHEDFVDETLLQRAVPFKLNWRGPAVAVGPLDGKTESIVVGGTTHSPLKILHRTAGQNFTEINAAEIGTDAQINDGPILLFDANGDGALDLLVTKGGNSQPAGATEFQPKLYLNNGEGALQAAAEGTLPTLENNVGAAAAVDFDRDGWVDVFLGSRVLPGQYPFSPHSVLLANRNGKFQEVTDALAPGLGEVGMVTAALWSDVDNDGWPDLLLTLDWGPVRYFHNDHGRSFSDWSEKAGFLAAGYGWWTSITGADFNHDGRIDYVVGNVGLNTPYKADSAHPAVIFAGDFKGDGATELVEGHYEGATLYPWRSRRDLGSILPAVLKRFPSADSYASATLAQVVGPEKLGAAQRFAVTELRSGIFLSQPDGTYRFEALPRMAQLAPFQGIVTGDFDGDGNVDIYAVQNSFAPINYVGRFDGGLSQLLLGDGQGHFTVVAPAESGLVVPGDAKGLALVDLDDDGWPDFFVTRNNSTSLAFRNAGRPGAHALKFTLKGSKGNPTAVGARYTVEFTDGRTEVGEVYAGSGYSSQSSACVFLPYREKNPPRVLRVRWPSGANTEESFVAPLQTSYQFSAPAP